MTHTIASMLANCDEDGDCLIWRGPLTSGGVPALWDASTSPRNCVRARRRMFELNGGKTTPAKPNVIATCWRALCMAPDHLKAVSRKEQMCLAAAAGRLVVPSRDAAQRRLKRANAQKLTMDKAREIRVRHFGGETLSALAREFDVHVSLVHRVVHNKAWAEGAANSSVFNWAQSA